MQRIFLALLAICLTSPAVLAETRTGEFETKFDTRSPLSSQKVLAERLGAKDATDDDDLVTTSFLCYVPPDAGSAGPLGLLVWLNYRPADSIPASLKPLLDKTHTIMVISKTSAQPNWARAGLALDAVSNLRQQYSIDDNRTYLLSLLKPDDTLGQQMGLAFGETFSGFIYALNFRYFRPIAVPGAAGETYAASFSRPANGTLTAASKGRRHVLVGDNKFGDTNGLIARAYQQDGYKALLTQTALAGARWPDIDPAWVAAALDLLDSNPPTTAPGTRTAAAQQEYDPKRLLSLAKAYEAARQPDLAKAKLRDLLTRFPTDPVAKEAGQMLERLDRQ